MSNTQTNVLLDNDAHRIVGMIVHQAATQMLYRVFLLESLSLAKAKLRKWNIAVNLGDPYRNKLKGKSIFHYFNIWKEVRQETLLLTKPMRTIGFRLSPKVDI